MDAFISKKNDSLFQKRDGCSKGREKREGNLAYTTEELNLNLHLAV